MKIVSEQEVASHAKRANPWWDGPATIGQEIRALRPRAYLPLVEGLLRDAKIRRAVVLLGPRRVGKTYLVHHLIQRLLDDGVPGERIAYLAVDHPILHGQSLESLAELLTAGRAGINAPSYLFFDEVQYLKDWERHLKILVDARPDLRILVSGSAAAALRRKSSESGAGRFTDFLLPPLTFSEFVELGGHTDAIEEVEPNTYRIPDIAKLNELFVDYLNFGGYPELAFGDAVRRDPARFIKSDIVDKVLLRDLPSLYGIDDVQELNYLFSTLAYNTAEEVSLEKLSQRSELGKPTITKYIEYLEAAFLVRRVSGIDRAGKRFQRERQFKIYLTNPAMRTALYGSAQPDDESFGHLVETALFAQRFHETVPLHYARWKGGEIDMVDLGRDLRPLRALEVKWSDRTAQHPDAIGNVFSFCKENGLTSALATTKTAIANHERDGMQVSCLPASMVCYHLGRRAIEGRSDAARVALRMTDMGGKSQ